jgi:ankyrin repeat protein
MPKALPALPNLDWLKKTAKQRLQNLRALKPDAKLYEAQLALANDYGFMSWRALKAHIDALDPAYAECQRVFVAAREGDVASVRRAFENGFDPRSIDDHGYTIYQIGKEMRLEALELLAIEFQERERRPQTTVQAINAMIDAAWRGEVGEVRRMLDAHPDLVNAIGGTFEQYTALHRATCRSQHACIRLLLDRGADVHLRDFPDNATPVHLAASVGDLETLRLLVDAGSDLIGEGEDYGVGVLGWATCFHRVREDVADYLLSHGARLNLWTAIALDRAEELRAMIEADRSLLSTRMKRNLHRRMALHHAVAQNRLRIVTLLLELGADPNAGDANGATPLTTASQENADSEIIAALLDAGAKVDFLTAINLKWFPEAEAMLREEPSRIGPSGRDTISLHMAVSKKKLDTIRWLIAHGIDVNAKRAMWDCNDTALHTSIENGSMEIARMLLDAGADPNIRDDKYKATALGWAEFFGREDFAALIRERGGYK